MCENSVKLIFLSLVIVNSLLVNGTQAITTTHHDKPAESRLPLMARTMMVRDEAATNASPKSTLMTSNVTLPLTERHKRLLPYMTFYLGREPSINGGNELRSATAPLKPNYVSVARPQDAAQYYKYQPIQQQQQRQQHNEAIETKTQFTPFLESNALPGPFLPIVRDPGIESKERQTGKLPNYSAIYDKLSQIKLQNDPRYKTIDYAPPAAYEPNYSTIQRTRPHLQFAPNAKTIVQSYTPTSVDLSPYDYRRKPQTHHQGGNKSPYGEFARPVIVFRPKPQKDYAYIQQQLLSDDKPHVVYVQKPQSARPHYQPFPTPSQSHPYVDSKSNQAILLKKLPPTDETNGQHDVHPAILRHHHQQLQQQQQPYVYVEDNKQFNRQQLRPVFVSPTEPPQTAPIFVEPIYVDNDKPQRNRPVLVASKPIYVKGTQQQHSGTGDDYLRDDQQLYGKGAKVIEEQQLVNYEEQQPQPVNYEENQHQQQQQHYEQPFDQQYEKQPTPNYQTITEPYDYPTTTITNAAATEDPNNLSLILKNLQETNALPETLTPENIDNSIKTLVRILSALKKEPKFARPIVVQEEETGRDYVDETDNETGDVNNDDFDSVHHYPQDTQEGGTPGKPGVDYPALSSIPPTSFNCKTQRYKGFFGDPDTHCQVWHYCDLNGGQASFLCPNGTIFSQVALTCDWWYNVKCATTTQLYVLNERLYKYILPLSPKFPEDYSGPLVDRYLALKFREMEAKMKKERKQKQKDSGEDDDKEAPKTDDADDLKLASEQTTTETASYEDDVSSTSAEKL